MSEQREEVEEEQEEEKEEEKEEEGEWPQLLVEDLSFFNGRKERKKGIKKWKYFIIKWRRRPNERATKTWHHRF